MGVYNSINDDFEYDLKAKLGANEKYSANFKKFGNTLGRMMFVTEFNLVDDFLCLRMDQVSLLMFQMAYLRYIKHQKNLKDMLTGFLDSFFRHSSNIKEQKVYFNLFRSFYSFHLHLFLRLDQKLINQMMILLSDLKEKNNRLILIED